MNVASLERCKELYELSGWLDTRDQLVKYSLKDMPILLPMPKGEIDVAVLAGAVEWTLPAYDLGYLLRKLPAESNVMNIGDKWFRATHYLGGSGFKHIYKTADTPEDAACKLAIELFKQGILTKETV